MPGALHAALEGHLGACSDCRQQATDLRAVWKILDEAPVVSAPAGFRSSVLQRIEKQEEEAAAAPWYRRIRFRVPDRRQILVWGAAGLLLVALGSIAAPGRYSSAWLGYLGWSRSQSQFVAARPIIQHSPAGVVVTIPLDLTDANGKSYQGAPIPLGVRIIGDTARVVGGSTLNLTGHGPANVTLAVAGGASEPVLIEVSRRDGGEPATQILTIPIPRP